MRVLVVARSDAAARRWAAMLDRPKFAVRLGQPCKVADFVPDVLVTDWLAPDDPPNRTASGTVLREGAWGVVRIGARDDCDELGPADACLPEDFAPRELRLACRLLGEVVRLRREQRARVEMARRLAQQAMTDPLTGLPNRRAWDDALAERVGAARSSTGWLCVAILDLDHFKRVNDDHGHPAGDEVLRSVARALSSRLRQDDFVARVGGDEFGLLLWVSGPSAAVAVVDRVRRALPAAASAGCQTMAPAGREAEAAITASPPRPQDLFAAADQALRMAKQQGRGRTVSA